MRRFLVDLVCRRRVLVALGECTGEPGEVTSPRGEPGEAGWALCCRPGLAVGVVVGGVVGESGETGELPPDADKGRAFSFCDTLFSRTYVNAFVSCVVGGGASICRSDEVGEVVEGVDCRPSLRRICFLPKALVGVAG